MESLRALYFGPGLPPQGKPVSVRMIPEGLCFSPDDSKEETISCDRIQVGSGGFDHDQILLTWTLGSGLYSLSLTDPSSKKTFLAQAPASLTPQLLRRQKKIDRVRRTSRAGWMALALILLLPIFLLAALWTRSDRILNWVAGQISIETEERLGDLIFAQTRQGLKMLSEGEAVKTIEEIGGRLSQGGAYRFKWHVAENPAINAFAIPGGHIVVFTGLIRAADSAEEVAGVLAHETQHVTRRHSLKGLIHDIGWRGAIALLVGDFPGGELAAQLGTLRFGREQESEADLKGLLLLKEAGINPEGMITFFDKLSQEEGPSIPFLSTHPLSDGRAEALRAQIQQIGPWKSPPLPFDWEKIKSSLP